MCEFLIRIKPKAEVDPDFASPVEIAMNTVHRSAKLLHAGDVVSVCANGWGWTHAEHNNPEWRIVKVPGMPLDEGESFASREFGDGTRGLVLRRRHFTVDITKLRAQMTADDFKAAVSVKPKLRDLTTL